MGGSVRGSLGPQGQKIRVWRGYMVLTLGLAELGFFCFGTVIYREALLQMMPRAVFNASGITCGVAGSALTLLGLILIGEGREKKKLEQR